MSSTKPIGIFDSGIGGLSVLTHIRNYLPAENLLYVADSKHLPYGTKSAGYITDRALCITDFFITQGVKSVIVACNTATAAAITTLRKQHDIPIVGMEPGVKPGVEQSRNGKVAILATEGTLSSTKFKDLLQRFSHHATVWIQPCHGWVEIVEEQQIESTDSLAMIQRQLTPLLRQNVDTLVLGCTHYPFLKSQIEKIVDGHAIIIDTGVAVAKQLKRRLATKELMNNTPSAGIEQFWSSAPNTITENIISRLWGKPCKLNQLPE